MFISMWDNVHSEKQKPKKESENHFNDAEQIISFLTEPSNKKKDNKDAKNAKKINSNLPKLKAK